MLVSNVGNLLVLVDCSRTLTGLFGDDYSLRMLRVGNDEWVAVILLTLYPSRMVAGDFSHRDEFLIGGFADEPIQALGPGMQAVIPTSQLTQYDFTDASRICCSKLLDGAPEGLKDVAGVSVLQEDENVRGRCQPI